MYTTTAIFGMLSYILVHSYNHVHKIEICQFIEIGKFSFLPLLVLNWYKRVAEDLRLRMLRN